MQELHILQVIRCAVWHIFRRPAIRLEPGLLVRGSGIGQGQILSQWHQGDEWVYFICQIYGGRKVLLAIPEEWQENWQKKLYRKCSKIWKRIVRM